MTSKKRVTIYIDSGVWDEVKEIAWSRRESASVYTEKVLRYLIDNRWDRGKLPKSNPDMEAQPEASDENPNQEGNEKCENEDTVTDGAENGQMTDGLTEVSEHAIKMEVSTVGETPTKISEDPVGDIEAEKGGQNGSEVADGRTEATTSDITGQIAREGLRVAGLMDGSDSDDPGGEPLPEDVRRKEKAEMPKSSVKAEKAAADRFLKSTLPGEISESDEALLRKSQANGQRKLDAERRDRKIKKEKIAKVNLPGHLPFVNYSKESQLGKKKAK